MSVSPVPRYFSICPDSLTQNDENRAFEIFLIGLVCPVSLIIEAWSSSQDNLKLNKKTLHKVFGLDLVTYFDNGFWSNMNNILRVAKLFWLINPKMWRFLNMENRKYNCLILQVSNIFSILVRAVIIKQSKWDDKILRAESCLLLKTNMEEKDYVQNQGKLSLKILKPVQKQIAQFEIDRI